MGQLISVAVQAVSEYSIQTGLNFTCRCMCPQNNFALLNVYNMPVPVSRNFPGFTTIVYMGALYLYSGIMSQPK